MPRTYYIKTYGCQMNERDTEIIQGYLEKMGLIKAQNEKEADIIMLNTCCVREKAEKKVFGKLGELKKIKEEKKDLIIGITGCMTQQKEIAEKIYKNTNFIDFIMGTLNLHELPTILNEAMHKNSPVLSLWEKEGEIIEDFPSKRSDSVKAYINISYGCNNYCSYCVVPYVRGRERSRRPEDIINEVQLLAEKGYKETMLLGQNVNSYGQDLNQEIDFADLLEKVNEIEGIERIRYMTSHPKDFNTKLIKTITKCKKVCEHFHLPLQSGSNKILKIMNRKYSREHYLQIVKEIRKNKKNAAITTDIIVGFPGETEEDFLLTLDMVEKVRFDSAFTFIYSPRTNTLATEMTDELSYEEKNKRLLRLNEIQDRISREINEKMVGLIEEILVESFSKTDNTKLSGRTRQNKIVIFEGSKELIGKFKKVKITKAQTWNLVGEIV